MARWRYIIINKQFRKLRLLLRRLVHGDRFTVHGQQVIAPPLIDAEIRSLLAKGYAYEEAEARIC